MERMLDAPEKEPVPGGPADDGAEQLSADRATPATGVTADEADEAAEAPDAKAETKEIPRESSGGARWPRTLHAAATRRALLLSAPGWLLIAGLVTALPAVGTGPGRMA